MRKLFAVGLAALALAGSAGAAPLPGRPHVADTSGPAPDGGRILQVSIEIEAPRAEVWKAFSTTDGLKRWQAPVAAIDLRVGGEMEASYDPKARLGDPNNIRNRIEAYVPERLLVIRNVNAPKGFRHPDLFGRTVTVLQFDDAGPGRTRVTCSGVGFGSGADWDELFEFFRQGNAWVLEQLKAHVEGGAGPTGPAHPPAARK